MAVVKSYDFEPILALKRLIKWLLIIIIQCPKYRVSSASASNRGTRCESPDPESADPKGQGRAERCINMYRQEGKRQRDNTEMYVQ